MRALNVGSTILLMLLTIKIGPYFLAMKGIEMAFEVALGRIFWLGSFLPFPEHDYHEELLSINDLPLSTENSPLRRLYDIQTDDALPRDVVVNAHLAEMLLRQREIEFRKRYGKNNNSHRIKALRIDNRKSLREVKLEVTSVEGQPCKFSVKRLSLDSSAEEIRATMHQCAER